MQAGKEEAGLGEGSGCMHERTLVILKPDAVNRGLLGKLVSSFEQKGLKIAAMKMVRMTDSICNEHYSHLASKPFFANLKKFMMSSPVVCMVLEGAGCVEVARKLCGATNGRDADPGTLRGDFSMSTQCNLVHASDSGETAQKEIKRFFSEKEIYGYKMALEGNLYGEDER